MGENASDQATVMDPTRDDAFERLLSAWTEGSLGFDKHEGVGLLWKEGLMCDLLITMFRRAPLTMRALGRRLAEGAPQFADDKGYVPQRLISEFVETMNLPLPQRRERFEALDLPEPGQ